MGSTPGPADGDDATPPVRDGRGRVVTVLVLLAVLAVVVAGAVAALRGNREKPAGGGPPDRGPTASASPVDPGRPVEVRVASFNVLGSTHTTPRGNRPELASGPDRVAGVLRVLDRHGVSVVGFQEMQPDQRATFRREATGWRLLEGRSSDPRAGENAVAWREDTWSLVRSRMLAVPDTGGVVRPMPVVVLRDRASGVLVQVATFHNPADTRRFPDQQRYRVEATAREVALARATERAGLPQVVTGDMNERAGFFCRFAGVSGLRATVGGTASGGGAARPTRRRSTGSWSARASRCAHTWSTAATWSGARRTTRSWWPPCASTRRTSRGHAEGP